MPSSEPVLVLDAVAKRFPAPRAGPDVEVLRGVSLTLAAGESVAIMGPSGSGKSTLLGLAGAMEPPSSGAVRIGGRDISTLSPDALAKVRRDEVGFVFQQALLLPHCTALENVLVPLLADAKGVTREGEAHARELLSLVRLGARLSHKPAELSGGERQRVAIARALVRRPRLLLADEPTGALDRKTAEEMARLLFQINAQQGTALLIVTHSPVLAARASRTYDLDEGLLNPRGAA
jgi:lipoprotein-releasing system ATP-binding protein